MDTTIKLVKEPVLNIGIINPGQKIDLRWEFVPGAENLPIHFIPDCGCTANPRLDNEENPTAILASFTEEDVIKLTDKQKRDWYPEGKIPISKNIKVFIRSDKNMIDLDPVTNQTRLRPEAPFVYISFMGYARTFEQAPVGAL